jgi:hypothetical protein
MSATTNVFRTVQLGTAKTVQELVETIRGNGGRVSYWAQPLLSGVTITATPTQVQLTKVTGAQLGFTGATSRREIYERAFSLGLGLCPAEVGLELCRQYSEQPVGEWLLIAMGPISVHNVGLRVFVVGRREEGQLLHADYGDPDSYWGPDITWVFICP